MMTTIHSQHMYISTLMTLLPLTVSIIVTVTVNARARTGRLGKGNGSAGQDSPGDGPQADNVQKKNSKQQPCESRSKRCWPQGHLLRSPGQQRPCLCSRPSYSCCCNNRGYRNLQTGTNDNLASTLPNKWFRATISQCIIPTMIAHSLLKFSRS